MLNKKNFSDKTGNALVEAPGMAADGLEEELDSYSRSAVTRIRFNVVIKPAIISLIALIV
jgi:hypothetical protein